MSGLTGAREFGLWHAPLRVRSVPDDPANYDYQAWIARAKRICGKSCPFTIHGRPAAAPLVVPVLPPRRDWAVESSERRALRDESARRWFVVARFVSRDDAADFCRRWRASEDWLRRYEEEHGYLEPIFYDPSNEVARRKRLIRSRD